MRVNTTITIGAAPINLATGSIAADDGIRKRVNRILVQMLPVGVGNTGGVGYVMDGIQNSRVPSIANATDVTAVLNPGSEGSAGGDYQDSDPEGNIDLSRFWIHGAHAGDPVKVSYDLRI